MQAVETRRRVGFLLIAIAVLLASFVVVAPRVQAAGGDFGLDFVAAEPTSYSHVTGGGAFGAGITNVDVVESLEGGDFSCGDTVSYLLKVVNSATPSAANQTLAFSLSFDADTTGQSGAAHVAVTNVAINYDVGDTAIIDNGNSTIANSSWSQNGALFQSGSHLDLSFQVTNMEAGETVVVRVDTTLGCDPGSAPTGNLHASLSGSAVVVEDGGSVVPPDPISQGSGRQDITFKVKGLAIPPASGEIIVVKQTLPDGATPLFNFTSDWGAFRLGDGHTTSSGDIDAGSYFVSETPTDGWTLFSSVCDDGSPVSNINVGEGETVTCTFVNKLIPLIPASVSVSPGTCDWIDESSVTDVSFTVDPGATLTIMLGDVVIGTYTASGSIEVGPGDYTWTATAANGYEINGSASGNFTAISCEIPPQIVTVDVTVGTCGYIDGESRTDVIASIDPSGAATIVIDGTMNLTIDGQTLALAPGDHSWTAVAAEGYVLEGTSGADFTTEACPPPGSIGDTVWHDLNANGVQDAGEPGTAGITVSLLVDGGIIATTTTDASGNYLFEGLGEGDYVVAFAIPDPWVATTPDAGDDATDSDIDPAGKAPAVTLGVGEDNLTVDAGLVRPSTITVEKVTNPVAAGSFAFTGDIEADLANGESAFSTVLPGTYTVSESIPDGWALIDISCTTGGTGDLATATATYTVASGDSVTCTYTNTNVGTIIVAKATDTATEDRFDFTVGEDSFDLGSGESIELDLPSGIYTITEDLLLVDGWDLASIVCSGEPTVDGNSVSLFVPPAQTVGCTFVNTQAEVPLGVVGDFVWNDVDGNGIQDANESGVANVGVDLLDATSGSVLLSTTTNAAGVYVVANVPEGDYVMQFAVPEPWVFSPADAGSDDAADSDVVEVVGVSAGAAGLLTGASSSVLAAGGTVGRTALISLVGGATNVTIDAGVFQLVVLPEPPISNPETPVVTPPVTIAPTVDDTKVLGIQTTLPQTGFADWQAGVLAVALVLAGVGMLMAFRKEEDIIYMTSGFSDRLGL
ncbi:MAG: hypothetical protein JJE47_03320 [Acidimicrobiia bacterium]|nr:hypothetical protein [Acidimicrobiia bacterium]